MRYPILLSTEEKTIASKVSRTFQSFIIGFDILRTNGKSYVCDINGFSFVKNTPNYYTDCAHLLKMVILTNIAPQRLRVRQKV